MKAYGFRLQALLRVRRTQALVARQEVARTLRQLQRAAEQEAAAAGVYDDFVTSGRAVQGGAFLARFEQGERLAGGVAGAQATRRERQDSLERARDGAVRAERAVTLLEKLDQRRRQEWRLASEREDAATMDEVATVRAATARIATAATARTAETRRRRVP